MAPAMALALTSFAATSSRAENELVTHTVEAYGSTGACAGDALSNSNEDDDYFDNGFTSYGQIEHWQDLAVDGRDFVDSDNFSWGEEDVDPYGTDFADVIFFSGHAGSSCASGAERSYLVMGDDGETCNMNLAHVNASSQHMTFGGNVASQEADALVTFACETTQYCVYTAGGYDNVSASGGQFNLINGFHGWVVEISGYQSLLSSYSNAAKYNDMGEAWLDWLYDTNVNGGGDDNCPSSIVFGANATEIDDYYSYAGWLDFHDNGSRTTSKMFRLCGCDPLGGSPLPGC